MASNDPSLKSRRLPGTVIALGFVNFFTDVSGEMIYPLLPDFLSRVLKAGPAALGIIEGIAESTASLLKLGSGLWADRIKRRKPFVLIGYVFSSAVRPLIGLATAWPFVLLMRFLDRFGKGIRTAPRDALIADSVDPSIRGAAFGFHQAMDHAGAVTGPLIAAALFGWLHLPLRQIFFLSGIPAALVIIIVMLGVKEPPQAPRPAQAAAGAPPRGHWSQLGGYFHWLFFALLIFTLGNSTDLFLIRRLNDAGVNDVDTVLLYSLHHVVKMVSTYLGGRASDRIGRRRLMIAGWLLYGLVYLAFAIFSSVGAMIAIFLVYGIYFGLTEPVEKAWVADLAPAHLRATAFGYYNGAMGLAALPASVLFGFIWKVAGPAAAFGTGAALALTATAMLLRLPERSGQA